MATGGACRAGSQAHFVATGDRLWQILVLSAASLFVTWLITSFFFRQKRVRFLQKVVTWSENGVCVYVFTYIYT